MILATTTAHCLLFLTIVAALPAPNHELTPASKTASAYTWQQHSSLAAEIRSKTKPRESRWSAWTGQTPSICEQKAGEINSDTQKRLGCETQALSTIEVFYDDAPSSWLFCFCRSEMEEGLTEQQMVDDFGRLPIVLRQHVRHLMAFTRGHAPPGATAWALPTGDIIFWGLNFDLMLHEASHIMDNKRQFSSSGSFRQAIESDSCLASPYALSKASVIPEVWAEAFMVRRYQIEVVDANKAPESTVDTSCMSRQLDVIRQDTDSLLAATFNPEYCLKKDIEGDAGECCKNPRLAEGKWKCNTASSDLTLEELAAAVVPVIASSASETEA